MSEATGSALLDEALEATPTDPSARAEQEAFTAKASRMEMIPTSLIRKSDVALRGVQRQTEKYQLLLQSVKTKGILNSITVREQIDPTTGTKFYGLIDGLQRFTAAGDAGLTEVPCHVVNMDDAEILEAQLIGNLQRIDTRPADVSKHLLRVLARNPFMTKNQLAERVCQSTAWVEQRLALDNLLDEIKELVNVGKIHLTNAYALSQIDQEEQKNYVERAMTESPKTFVPSMKQRKKELRDAKKSGTDASKAEFTPVMYMQKVGDVKKEVENGAPTVNALLQKSGLTSPDALEGARLALAWVLHYDAESKAEQKREHDQKEAERAAQKEKLKAEREAKKQQDAAEAAANIEKGW